MPLMEVVLEQQFVNQSCINRWNYVASGTPASVTFSFALLAAMGAIPESTTLDADTLMGKLQILQSPGVFFVQAIAKAVYIDDDFFDNPFFANTHGIASGGGESGSPFEAFGFRSTRVKQSIGRGYKRFVGVTESDTTNGGLFVSGTQTLMTAVADEMAATLTYDDSGNTLTFTPAVAQKEKYTTPSDRTAYKYYATESEQDAHLAEGIGWELYTSKRTQNSRQYGRGI